MADLHLLKVNARVRWISDHPEYEPIGTIYEFNKDGLRIEWDDNHPNSIVPPYRWPDLEVV